MTGPVQTLSSTMFLVFLACMPLSQLRGELKKPGDRAQKIYEETEKIIFSSLQDAACVGAVAVREAFKEKFRIDREAIRFIARTAATTLADDAVEAILMKETERIAELFGNSRSGAIARILVDEYCSPVLHDIIDRLVDHYFNLSDPSHSGDTAALDIESIIREHARELTVNDIVRIVRSLENGNDTGRYGEMVASGCVNSSSYCATRNWKDRGEIHQYRINGTGIENKRGDEEWSRLPSIPFEGRPVSIACDNNRLLVLTDRHELWWYCVMDDQAQWSIDIMNTAVDFVSLKSVVGEELCNAVIPVLAEVVDSTLVQSSSIRHLEKNQKALPNNGTLAYWTKKCSLWIDIALSVDRHLLKAGYKESFTAKDYSDWSKTAHRGKSWSNLLSWTSQGHTFHRGLNISPNAISDIAIGNWNGTVVTVYAVAEGKIWFLDEEIIQPQWKAIENWNDKWALLGEKDYRPLTNSPYPLDGSSAIDASNSVIAAMKRDENGSVLYWIRWDYHQKDDFVYWPLDWCEHGWKSVICPQTGTFDFRINTIGNIDPREKGTVWSVPAPAFTFHTYLPAAGYQGIFGDVERKKIDAYPVTLFIRNTTDDVYTFSARRSKDVTGTGVVWTKQ